MRTRQSRYETAELETVATRVIAATGLFYPARGIGSQASVGAAVHEQLWAGKTHLINCFGIEMVLCDSHLKRFDLTNGMLFDTFVILFGTNYVVVITQYWNSKKFHH